jgi:hypothetical protein
MVCFKGNLLEQQEKNTDARRKEKRVQKEKKKDYCEKHLKWLQECDTKNKNRKFYKQVNRTRDDFQAKPVICRSTDVDILSDKADILNRWKEYFQICII